MGLELQETEVGLQEEGVGLGCWPFWEGVGEGEEVGGSAVGGGKECIMTEGYVLSVLKMKRKMAIAVQCPMSTCWHSDI